MRTLKILLHTPGVVICAIIAMALLITSFVLPPTGIIDNSILTAVGEIFAFACLFIADSALNKGKKATLQHGETTVTIGDDDTPEIEAHDEDTQLIDNQSHRADF